MPRRSSSPTSARRQVATRGVPSPRRAAAIRKRLLSWYRSSRRRLPWRERPDPYRVWVAEIMLQQTQVATVLPYYERFLSRFPDAASLATAEEDEVTALWSGLGYYARARHLHQAARLVMERHGGRLPSDREALETLPGIGRYTSGAILSIGFGVEEPVVDGNVRRLLSRLLYAKRPAMLAPRVHRERARYRSSPALLEAQARALLRGAPPADFNQALMELGALVCRPASPLCSACPVARFCRARRLGIQDQIPPPRRRPPTREETRAVALIRSGDRILLERASGPGAPLGLWDLPGTLVPPGEDPGRALERHLRRRGLQARIGGALASVDHSITFRKIRSTAYEARLEGSQCNEDPATRAERQWVERRRLAEVPLGAAARKLLAADQIFFSG